MEQAFEVIDLTSEDVLSFPADGDMRFISYSTEFLPWNLSGFSKSSQSTYIHLLHGQAILFLSRDASLDEILPLDMKADKLYKVNAGAYYCFSLSEKSQILALGAQGELVDTPDLHNRLTTFALEIEVSR